MYLLPSRGEGYFLYTEPEPLASVDEAPATASEPVPEAGTAPAARRLWSLGQRAYTYATRRRRDRERLLGELGALEGVRVRVHYASSMTDAGARRAYEALIEEEVKKHKTWMLVDVAALPVSVPLSLVPGPNVLLAYLAWRSVTHYRAKKAGERAAELTLEFLPEDALDEIVRLVREGSPLTVLRARRFKSRLRAIGEDLGLRHLDRAY